MVGLSAGNLRTLVTLANPRDPVDDTDASGYTVPYTNLSPATAWASIAPATAKAMERLAAGSVVSNATHLVTFRYHAGVNTKTRITWQKNGSTRTLYVVGVVNVEERDLATVAICTEDVN